MMTRSLEVSAEDLTQRRLTFDAFLLFNDFCQFGADGMSLFTDERVHHLLLIEVFLLPTMSHQHADLIAELSAHRCVTFEFVHLLALHAQFLHLDFVVLRQVQILDAVSSLLFGFQVATVDKGLDDLLEAFHQTVLLHGLDDHVWRELQLVVIHEDDSIVGVDLLQPIEEVEQSGDLGLCLDDLIRQKEKNKG